MEVSFIRLRRNTKEGRSRILITLTFASLLGMSKENIWFSEIFDRFRFPCEPSVQISLLSIVLSDKESF